VEPLEPRSGDNSFVECSLANQVAAVISASIWQRNTYAPLDLKVWHENLSKGGGVW
jgi:hypothetical protein